MKCPNCLNKPRCKHARHVVCSCGADYWARPDKISSRKCRQCGRWLFKQEAVASVEKKEEIDPQILRLERENQILKDELALHKRKLVASRRQENIFLELSEVIRQTVEPLAPVPVILPKASERQTPVDAVALISDEHADQVITSAGTWGLESYDFNIFRCRLHRWTKTVMKYLTVHLPRHRFERLWIFKLGDSVQGDIHGAGPRNHFGNTLKAALALGDAEAQAFQALSRILPVHIVGVSGNHPRMSLRKDYPDPHSNFDYLVMTQIATRLQKEIAAGKVSVHAPRAWSAYVEVRGRLWALNHGDDVRGYAGIPWYGFGRKHNKVQALVSRKGTRVKFFAHGHYHTAIQAQENDAESLHAGNWSVTDQFAAEALAAGSEPVQQLYAVDDDYGIVLPIPIYVRDEAEEARYREGLWEPDFGRSLIIDQISKPDEGFQMIRAS